MRRTPHAVRCSISSSAISCHGDKLEGDAAVPPLVGGDFRARWPLASLNDNKIRNTMPLDNPGKLTAGQASGPRNVYSTGRTAGSDRGDRDRFGQRPRARLPRNRQSLPTDARRHVPELQHPLHSADA